MKDILNSLRKLGLAPLLTMAGVALGMIAVVAYLALTGAETGRMTLLYDNLDQHDASQVAEQLERRQVPYRLEADGKRIMVPSDQVLSTRASLAKDGLPASGTIVGNEIFDRANDLTVTEFEQDVKRTRALEGELERTIEAMQGIQRARVHLVLPRKQPFERAHAEAQASIMLTLRGMKTLPTEGIQAIVNLTAGAVPNLKPQNITLVDSHLHLLAQAGDPEDMRTRSMLAEDLARTIKTRLERSVEDMLLRTLGNGHVHAEASVQLNFDKTADTQERYDPDSPVVRSTQTVTSNSKSTERSNAVSVQNNLPNADSGGGAANGNQEGRQEETTNYEISKSVRSSTRDQPRLERVTLAVMVDGIDEVGADGKHTWRPRAQAELDQIGRLAQSAIGFDEKRGDRVEVVSMPFINEIGPADTETPAPAVKMRRDLITLGEAGAIGVTALVIIVLMTRSIIQGLKPPSLSFGMAPTGELPAGEGVAHAPGTALALTGTNLPASVGSGAGDGHAELEDSTVSMTNIEGQIRASSIRQLVDLTSRHPDATLAIIRNWLASGNG